VVAQADRAAEAAPDLAEGVEFRVVVVASEEAEQALVAAVAAFQEGIFGTRVLELAPDRRQRLVLTADRVFHTAPEPAWRKIRPQHFRR